MKLVILLHHDTYIYLLGLISYVSYDYILDNYIFYPHY